MKQNQFSRLEQAREHIGKSYNAISKELNLKTPQVFYDIKAGKSSVSYELARTIQDKFLISSAWLLTGEGEMLKDESISQNAYGDNNQIAGRDINNGVSGNTTTTNNTTNNHKDSGAFDTSLLEKAIDEMGEQRKLFAEQINRLLTIIEKMSNK